MTRHPPQGAAGEPRFPIRNLLIARDLAAADERWVPRQEHRLFKRNLLNPWLLLERVILAQFWRCGDTRWQRYLRNQSARR